MAGSVAVIGACFPQRDARQRIEIDNRAFPSESFPSLMAMTPFSTSVKKRLLFLRHIADGNGARDIGGAVHILAHRSPPGTSSPSSIAAVAIGGHAVMDDRGVRAGARNRIEGNVLERVLHALADRRRARACSSFVDRLAISLIGTGLLAGRAMPGYSTIAAPS